MSDQPTSGIKESADTATDRASVQRIKVCLAAEDDTTKFVGFALIKSVLDHSPALIDDEDIIKELWGAIPVKFLDRLLRTGSKPSSENGQQMLDLAVSVLHTFLALLSAEARHQASLTGRIPFLVPSLLHSSPETTELLLQILQVLVSCPEGAQHFVQLEDISPLTEIASNHPAALDVLDSAWRTAMFSSQNLKPLTAQIDLSIQQLMSCFTGTDASTLLGFLAKFLRLSNSQALPSRPGWLKTVVSYIQNLVISRPNALARAAYTHAAAELLQAYPNDVPQLLFPDKKTSGQPSGYMLINLLLIDIRASAPILLQNLNRPIYEELSTRLASALDVVSMFVGFLVRSLEDDSLETMIMSPDNLLKLRKAISETMSLTIEFLRDRWDASVAGAMGLHPKARLGEVDTHVGSHRTLAWDSMDHHVEEDPLTLAAIKALSIWLQEDDNELLRKEATGLMDMYLELYSSRHTAHNNFQMPVLVALNALCNLQLGREQFLRLGGWIILSTDLCAIISAVDRTNDPGLLQKGLELTRVLLAISEEQQRGQINNEQFDIITAVATWDTRRANSATLDELVTAVLMLCCSILARASSIERHSYVHSIRAIRGICALIHPPTVDSEEIMHQLDGFCGQIEQTCGNR